MNDSGAGAHSLHVKPGKCKQETGSRLQLHLCSAVTLMTEQVEKLMYELSMWRASPELKVHTYARLAAGVG